MSTDLCALLYVNVHSDPFSYVKSLSSFVCSVHYYLKSDLTFIGNFVFTEPRQSC